MDIYRKFTENKLIIASNNKGKAEEICQLLRGFNPRIEVETLERYNLESPEETGVTFLENAILKANYYSKILGMPVLADDSGLVVDLLDGQPGVYSARWAGDEKNFYRAMRKIQTELEIRGYVESPASFVCALSLRWADGHIESFEGQIAGKVSFPPKGEAGFGYDPIFTPTGYEQTFSELGSDIKNTISHRSRALNLLLERCFK